MAALDPKAYEEAVVKPLKRRSAGALPDDLVTRYAVDLSMADPDVVRRLAEIRSHWNKSALAQNKPLSVKSVYKAFLRADEALQREHGADLNRIDWWRQYDTSRQGSRAGQIAELAQTLRTGFGDLGLVSKGQLKALLDAEFASLAPAEVAKALTAASVSEADPVGLPQSSGLPDVQYRELERGLVDADLGSVPELVHGQLKSFTVLKSFTSDPPSRSGLTAAAITEAVDRENRRSGNQPARQALNILSSAARNKVDLRELALFHLLEDVRSNHRSGVPTVALLKRLTARGLAPDEARQALFSVLNESARAPVTGLAAVQALLEEGRLVAAQQMLATITGSDDATAARALVDQQVANVRKMRDAASQALRRGDEDEARQLYRQAVALASDDAELSAELGRIPLPPPLELTAHPDGLGVRLSWRRAVSHDDQTRYRVVRQDGRAPGDPGDGAVVHEGPGSVALDRKASAGRLVGYAVFAAGEGGDTWSRSVGTTIEVLPPVHDVAVSVEDGAVGVQWQVHPDAFTVEVTRPDGGAVRASGKTSFTDRLEGKGERAYTLVACYRRPDGAVARAAAVQVRASDRGKASAVTALRLAAVPGGAPRVAVTWRQQEPDAEVVLRRADVACRWEFGAVVPVSDMKAYGTELTGTLTTDGEWRTLTTDVPTGLFWYVPFTIGQKGALRGQDGSLGIALPLTDVRHQRLGEEHVLSWVWPEDAGTAEVRWECGGEKGKSRLTRQQYQLGGGFRLRCGKGDLRVRVRSVVAASGGECASADVELNVPSAPPRLRYSVQLARRPLLGGGTVRVRLQAEEPVQRCTVLVVVAPGTVMPRRPDDGVVVLRSPQDVLPDAEVELSAELPKMRKPYWIRCFIEEDGVAVLLDPPTKQLKVS
ncbi:hypothetical protein [Lentzea sp. NPDC051838]|uniref:tetratricopeptide repeat protein n=1 Tax=Lentzea sp. NPDC051838 TaxID=3154849 RepID=UPI0034231CBF